jgi:hypothetical protein
VGVVSHHLFDHSIGRMLATLFSQLSTSPHLNVTLFTTATPSPHDQARAAEKRGGGTMGFCGLKRATTVAGNSSGAN